MFEERQQLEKLNIYLITKKNIKQENTSFRII